MFRLLATLIPAVAAVRFAGNNNVADLEDALTNEERRDIQEFNMEIGQEERVLQGHVAEMDQLLLKVTSKLADYVTKDTECTEKDKSKCDPKEKDAAKASKAVEAAKKTEETAKPEPAVAAAVVDSKKTEEDKKVEAAPAKAVEDKKAQDKTVKKLHKVVEPVFPKEFDKLSQPLKSVMDSAVTLPMMVPMLEGMYDKFKDDIKNNSKLEKKSKARLKEYQDSYDELKKSGKNQYLLDEKLRALKYFKKQNEIQKRHYHAMLKMAHASMERLNKVKKMCKVAATGKKLDQSDMAELKEMLPPEIV